MRVEAEVSGVRVPAWELGKIGRKNPSSAELVGPEDCSLRKNRGTTIGDDDGRPEPSEIAVLCRVNRHE